MDLEIDKDNLLTYFGYLIKSFVKFEERAISREKLTQELDELKKLKVSPKIKKHIKKLEKRMGDVIEKEKKIIIVEKKYSEAEIKKKIDSLEKKLTKFIEFQREKSEGFKKVEKKVKEQVKEKKSTVQNLKNQILETEKLYNQLKKSKKYPLEDIKKIEKRLDELKIKLKKL